MNVGVPELLIVLLVFVLPAVCVVTAIDAGSKPDWAFEAARTSKTLWIVLPVVGIFLCFVGVVAVVAWFAVFRRRVTAAARRGPGGVPIA